MSRTFHIFFIFFISYNLYSQNYSEKLFYGQKLEPLNSILHGAGQDYNGFKNYYSLMNDDKKPIVFMYYNNIYNIGTNWAHDLKRELLKYKDKMIVIQFGLELVGSLEAIANGTLDKDINDLLDGCKELGLPIYIRIGYEFNGYNWNKYDPIPYKAAFIYLTDKIRTSDLEIATVWNYAPDGIPNFMDFYPGDQYVDWWSINIFEAKHTTNTATIAFIDSATSHNRPILIGESTPRYVGVLDGQADWNAWFVPFFNFIKANKSIKMTGYINWDWSNWTQWSNWGDARLESNLYVRNQFISELNDTIFFHGGTEKAFKNELGYTENNPPSSIQNVVVSDKEFPAKISWDPVIDESKIARYLIFRNDTIIDFTGKNEISLTDFDPYESLSLSVVTVDRAGNKSVHSDLISVNIPPRPGEPDNIILNGNFDFGTDFWDFQIFDPNAKAVFNIDTTSQISGKNSAHISVTNSTNTNYHIQLRQNTKVHEGKDYIIEYQAKASTNTILETWIQQKNDPYGSYASKVINLSTEVQTFSDTGFAAQNDDAYLIFMVGNSGNTNIWIDNITVLEKILPKGNEKISNGNFDNGIQAWNLNHYVPSVEGVFDIDTNSVLDGKNSAHVLIKKTTGINWNLQLQQLIDVKKDRQYIISYKVKSALPTKIETWLQQNHANYFGYANKVINLTGEIQQLIDTTTIVGIDDQVYMTFMLGTSGLAEIWFDNVSVIEKNILLDLNENTYLKRNPNKFELMNSYPNPFNPSTTISFSLPEKGLVELSVFNSIGEKLQELINSELSSGFHTVVFDGSGLSSGIYFYRIKYLNNMETRKIVILK